MPRGFAHCDGPLPCPAGQSPFHIKGEFYRQLTATIEHFDKRTHGAVRAGLDKQRLKEFVSQKFLASTFYDVLPLPRIFMVIAAALKVDVRDFTRRVGKNAVEMSQKGIYQALFARLNTANFADRFPSILSQLYDFAPAVVTRDRDGATMVRDGMPLGIAEWWCLVTVPFVDGPLTANGARDLVIDWRFEPRPGRSPLPLARVTWDLRWR